MGKNRTIIVVSSLLLLVSLIGFAHFIFTWRTHYTKKFDPSWFKRQYESSQWIIPNSKTPISDETLYAHAGFMYLKGTNPILINPETPPLGKYLIGLSVLFFGNQNIIILISAVSSLFLIFIITYSISNSILAASIGVTLTILNTSFREHLIHMPQLDIFQLMFLLAFVLFFSAFKKNGGYAKLFFSGIFFGGFISIKFFLIYWILINCLLIVFYFMKKEQLKRLFPELVIINTVGLIVYIISYFRYFALGGDFRSFLGVQKWIALFYSGSNIDMSKLYGNYLNLIFFNRWRFWFGGFPYYPYKYWNILWPITFTMGFFSAFKLLKTKGKVTKYTVHLLISFLLVYNLFLFATPIYPRYLLLLFIPLNILTAAYFGKLLEKRIRNFNP